MNDKDQREPHHRLLLLMLLLLFFVQQVNSIYKYELRKAKTLFHVCFRHSPNETNNCNINSNNSKIRTNSHKHDTLKEIIIS